MRISKTKCTKKFTKVNPENFESGLEKITFHIVHYICLALSPTNVFACNFEKRKLFHES